MTRPRKAPLAVAPITELQHFASATRKRPGLLRLLLTDPVAAWRQSRIVGTPGVTCHGNFWVGGAVHVAVADRGRIDIGPGLFAPQGCDLQARDNGHLVVGEEVSLEVGSRLAVACDATLEVADGVAIGPYNFLNAFGGDLHVGRWTIMGPHVSLHTVDHGMVNNGTPMRMQEGPGGDIVIEDDVWLGAGVVVTRSVRIGQGAVVAAGAVVCRDVEPYAIAGGVPARKIGERTPDTAQ